MSSPLTVVRGTNSKEVASGALVEACQAASGLEACLFIGYPILGSADGRHPIDALLISPQVGVVVFDLVEGSDLDNFEARQDEAFTRIQQRLLGYRELVHRRKLTVPISTISFAPRYWRVQGRSNGRPHDREQRHP